MNVTKLALQEITRIYKSCTLQGYECKVPATYSATLCCFSILIEPLHTVQEVTSLLHNSIITTMAYVNELAGSKLRSKMGSTLNEAVSAPSSSFAQQQLRKMGWQDGEGLGKNRQGMASHIRVTKRADEIGLGHVKPELQQQEQWWNNGMSDVFSKLNGGKKKKKQSKQVTDEDLFAATGGARFGMRAQRKQTGKWARAETISKEVEEEAKSKVEWNGTGKAKLLLTKEEKKKKRKNSDDNDDESHNVTDEDELPKKKKRRKERGSESGVTEEKKSKKKKKEKKSKKKKSKKEAK